MIYINFKNPEKGATMIEFSIVAIVFILFILATIDIARFFYTESILDTAAQKVLNYAQKVQYLDKDTRTMKKGSPEYIAFVKNYAKSINIGLKILNVAPLQSTSTTNKVPYLNSYLTVIPFKDGWVPPLEATASGELVKGNTSLKPAIPKVRIALLRPGDSLCAKGSPSGTCLSWVDHPDYCSELKLRQDYAPCEHLPIKTHLSAPPTLLYNYGKILKEHPFHVIIEADFKPIIPLLPFKLKARGTAVGFREFVTFSDAVVPDLPPIVIPKPYTDFNITFSNSAVGSIMTIAPVTAFSDVENPEPSSLSGPDTDPGI